MVRTLTKSEVSMVVLRLVIGGFYPRQHFVINRDGQVLASPAAREFLRRHPAWIASHHDVSDR